MPVSRAMIDTAVGKLDGLVGELMNHTGMPGVAVAVVHDGQTIYAKGFGTRLIGTPDAVDADTVFQLASVSKSVGATAVATQVGAGVVSWDARVHERLPWFDLADAYTTRNVTIGDLYAHRSGLPDHAGDRLEDIGFGQRDVLQRLRYLPLRPLREHYAYTNFGVTAGGIAAAEATGLDWPTLVERAIYEPLGMARTSSRFADFAARSNHVTGHRQIGGQWVPVLPPRMPDAQAPAASVTSSVNDMAKWLTLLLDNGVYRGRRVVDERALTTALSPQMLVAPAHDGFAASYSGYGFDIGATAQGRTTYSHSGAFELGASTTYRAVPSIGVAIVVLTNGSPVGVPEVLAAQFIDLVESGAIRRDWQALVTPIFAQMNAPDGSLVGKQRPSAPALSRPLGEYAGTYQNDYHGPATIALNGDSLMLSLGPARLSRPLAHWDGNVFAFTLVDENASPGTISKATFAPGRVTLEYYDGEGLGTFVR